MSTLPVTATVHPPLSRRLLLPLNGTRLLSPHSIPRTPISASVRRVRFLRRRLKSHPLRGDPPSVVEY